MKYSKEDIRYFAVLDMYCWVDNFENDGAVEQLSEKQQNIYWENIKEIKEKIKKYIVILEERKK